LNNWKQDQIVVGEGVKVLKGTRLLMWLKKLIIGSPIEGICRKAHRLVVGQPEISLAGVKDNAYIEQTFAVMCRSLSTNSNCVDVGCHKGSVLEEMLRLAPAGIHYAFEPIPNLYGELVSSFPDVKLYEIALSDSVGEASFQHVVNNPPFSGLKKRQYPKSEKIEELKVRTDLLDNIIPEDFPIAFIKIDVEGGELQVLRGAAKTIRRSKPVVVFEHGLGAADYYGTTPDQVYDFFAERCDLKVSLMEDWLRGDAPLTREGFNARYHGGEFYFMAHANISA
jgi:FkbM family methyltransferase